MTKYDIKLRRSSLTQGQIERHKDFKNLTKRVHVERRSYNWIKLVAAVFAVVIILGMFLLGFFRLSQGRPAQQNPDMEIFEEFKTE